MRSFLREFEIRLKSGAGEVKPKYKAGTTVVWFVAKPVEQEVVLNENGRLVLELYDELISGMQERFDGGTVI